MNIYIELMQKYCMSVKSDFVSKCNLVLSKYLSTINAQVTVNMMIKYQLNDLADKDQVPKDVEEKCIQVLFERVRIMKGNDPANQFMNEIKK